MLTRNSETSIEALEEFKSLGLKYYFNSYSEIHGFKTKKEAENWCTARFHVSYTGWKEEIKKIPTNNLGLILLGLKIIQKNIHRSKEEIKGNHRYFIECYLSSQDFQSNYLIADEDGDEDEDGAFYYLSNKIPRVGEIIFHKHYEDYGEENLISIKSYIIKNVKTVVTSYSDDETFIDEKERFVVIIEEHNENKRKTLTEKNKF